ncbi:hypothetical protein WJX74_010700 [Apatococcus lobatus]|uniref:Uncharacterized protein n=1 Tax=Apatococcus lobatus TaxID=904363 RepID=A0AAW1R3R9_9CHLO
MGRQQALASAVRQATCLLRQSQSATLSEPVAEYGGRVSLLTGLSRTAWQTLPRSPASEAHRFFSTGPAEQSALAKARQAVNSITHAPGRAAKSASKALSGSSNAVYSRLPRQAQKLITSASQPGQLQKALGLQAEAFWQAHRRKFALAACALGAYFLWKTLFGVTSIFVNLSETMAETGFLALAVALVAFLYLYLRRKWGVNADTVYRNAMYQLNTNAGVLEVMGAPLAGSDVRAYVSSGGGLRLKGLLPRFRSRRLQMIFPLRGSDRRGLVSLEAKKLHGTYRFKLLAVDVPAAAGAEQRIFLEGDQQIYARGGVMGELRDPFLRALSLKEVHEEEDEMDDAAQEAEELQAERIREAELLSRKPKSMDEGGGMYAHERAYHSARGMWQRMFAPAQAEPAAEAHQGQEAARASDQASSTANMLPGDAQQQEPEGKVASEAATNTKPPAPWGPGS